MKRKPRAIGLLSGGLDSTLAARLLQKLGVEVIGVNFNTGFCGHAVRRQTEAHKPKEQRKISRNESLRAGADLEIPMEVVDISEEYLHMVTRPRHGYGANANPCIDCRIHMFTKAKELMVRYDADFIFTGEVLGQRPMSQHRRAMETIEAESGLKGKLLRPLSALLLPPTDAEKEGLIERKRLLRLNGRSRKPQINLADEWGVEEFPTPAGGCCFLTDESYARRFHDKVRHSPTQTLDPEDVHLLAVGRHLRLSPRCKLISGRNEGENIFLESFSHRGRFLKAVGVKGSLALLEGEASSWEVLAAASITARYGKGRDERTVLVGMGQVPDEPEEIVEIVPASETFLKAVII